MHDQPTQPGTRRDTSPPAPRSAPTAPSSSRMLASYLTDIEQLLDEQRWDAALREAFSLPGLAVALRDPQLRCTGEQVRTWCGEWIRPPGAERDAQALEFEPLSQRLTERVMQLAGAPGVPVRALRRLQLRRHLRTPPRGFFADRTSDLTPRETETLLMCNALLQAARRWYARSACHDTTVQGNLARLAVLR
jgi:hypothetical protein